jgi:hypothetical protein
MGLAPVAGTMVSTKLPPPQPSLGSVLSPQAQLGGICGMCELERSIKSDPPPAPPSQGDRVALESASERPLGISFPPLMRPAVAQLLAHTDRRRFAWAGSAGAALLLLVGLATSDDAPMALTTAAFGQAADDASGHARAALEAAPRSKTTPTVDGKLDGKVDGKLDGKVDGKLDGKVDGKVDGSAASATRDAPSATGARRSNDRVDSAPTKGTFNRDAARSAVFAAASNAAGCREARGPKGRGKASVTIAPSGSVTGVAVSGPFAGTKVGGCVARVFRGVRVPAFSGSAVTLEKSFTIR